MTARLFAGLADSAPDPILTLMDSFRRDQRPDKLDLGVGMYRDAAGRTPVMAAVKTAEQRLWNTQDTKAYVGLAGDPAFLRAFAGLALGAAAPADRLAMVGTPGGTGAVRQGFDLLHLVRPDARVWLPDPTWPNHPAIAAAVGCTLRHYPHAAPGAAAVSGDEMLAALEAIAPGDLLMLHGCCHNPTGLDLAPDLWAALGALCLRTGAVPFVDLAYLGLGDGLEADSAGLRQLVGLVPELLLAISGSKNFGLYRDRVGMLAVLTASPAETERVQATLNTLNRLNYTFPPDHGARLVQMILDDPGLRTQWETELAAMRDRLGVLRHGLAECLETEGAAASDGLRHGRGLFVQLPLTAERIDRLRQEHGLYMVADGRMNIAGLSETALPGVASALAPVLR